MTDTDFITKEIFQYEKNIEKLEQINEKQEIKLKENASAITDLQTENEELQKTVAENNINIEEKEQLIYEQNESIITKSSEIRVYKAQVEDFRKEIEALKNESAGKDSVLAEKTKRIEELERTSLSPTDLLFYYACKTDLALFEFVQQGKTSLTLDELKAKKIPIEFLEQVKKQAFETTNYVLTFSDNTYRIKSTKK